MPNRSTSRRSGAVTCAYGAADPRVARVGGRRRHRRRCRTRCSRRPAAATSRPGAAPARWGCRGAAPDSSSAAVALAGQSMPSPRATARSAVTASGSAAGRVRSTPIPASSMIRAAVMPVSSEISAFQSSTGVRLPDLDGPPAVRRAHDLLLGQLQLDRPAAHGQRAAQRPDLGERRDRRMDPARRRRRPARSRSRAGPATGPPPGVRRPTPARPRRRGRCRHSTAARGPSGSRLAASSESTGGCSGTDAVGQVHRLPAPAHLGVQRRARHDDGTEVGDGVVHAEAARPGAGSTPTAWSRSLEPGGSIVTSSTSVASTRSGPAAGRAAAAAAASASTAGGNPSGRPNSARTAREVRGRTHVALQPRR